MADYKKYFQNLISLSIPMIIGNIAHILIGTVDVLVAARHSVDTLAAISIANAIMMCLFIIGIGLMSGITPVISNYLGSSHPSKKYLLTTINYAMILAGIFCSITICGTSLIDFAGFEPHLTPYIKEYMLVVAFSYFGAYLHFALKEFLQAYEILAFPNALSVVAIFLNLFFNIIFVFGFGPIPAFGVVGLAIATVIVRSIMGLALLLYCFKSIKPKVKFDKIYVKQLLKVGYPISIALLLEFCAFNSITIIMGRISGLFAAAQSVVMTITSMTFMVPMAISNAIAIKVGFANGAKNYNELKNYSLAGMGLTFAFMTLCAVIMFLFPKQIISLITSDNQLLQICIPIILIAAVFQIFDGLQVAFGGILKGLKKTLFVTGAIILGYWILGLPLGAILALKYNMQLNGFWIGLAIAILIMAIFMGSAIVFMFKKLKTKYQ